ncbi:hypothetical protein AG1IA_02093 [Rhizoctonia solani AG-1 IA]|uniref:Uncharacterized protein n=1 Tax=Thanatephorus cucumeris (strain AG1-IA) TaxID=983506 RepID=L8X5H5_THACA|nr:hypothetical protein AG1IA_02093 [Rhizoctonia solani AG-1 IA]
MPWTSRDILPNAEWGSGRSVASRALALWSCKNRYRGSKWLGAGRARVWWSQTREEQRIVLRGRASGRGTACLAGRDCVGYRPRDSVWGAYWALGLGQGQSTCNHIPLTLSTWHTLVVAQIAQEYFPARGLSPPVHEPVPASHSPPAALAACSAAFVHCVLASEEVYAAAPFCTSLPRDHVCMGGQRGGTWFGISRHSDALIADPFGLYLSPTPAPIRACTRLPGILSSPSELHTCATDHAGRRATSENRHRIHSL